MGRRGGGGRVEAQGPLATSVSLRTWLYRLGRWLGDLGAVERGTVGRRVARRAVGKALGRALRRLFL